MIPSILSTQKNKAFSVVLFIELWERFGYYGMQSILVLFLVQHMNFNDQNANLLIGAFSAMTYAAPALGGWIGDKVIGNRRAMVSGTIILALGYLLLASATQHTSGIYITMAIISTGNGLFKPNAATLVRRIYEDNNSQLDTAFTLYYMAVNVGSTISMLLCPILQQYYGWYAAFLACFVGLTLGLLNYFFTHQRLSPYLPSKDQASLSWSTYGNIIAGTIFSIIIITFILQSATITQLCVLGAAIITLLIWIRMYTTINPLYKPGLKIMYLLTLEGMLYFVFYQQMSTSLTLFAARNINLDFSIGAYHVFTWSPGQFQALNPICIMILSPILAILYTFLGKKQKDFSIASKFTAGFVFVTFAFFLWWISCFYSKTPYLSSWVMIWGYFFLSLGELLISGLGLAIIARYVPTSMNGFMTGSYFMASGVSLYIGSQIANIAAPSQIKSLTASETLLLYQNLFFNLFMIAIIVLIIFVVFLPIIKKWNKQHHQNLSKL